MGVLDQAQEGTRTGRGDHHHILLFFLGPNALLLGLVLMIELTGPVMPVQIRSRL